MSDAAGSFRSPDDEQKVLAEQLARAWSRLSRELGIISCAAGLFVAVVWFLLNRRPLAHLRRLDSIAENLERMLALKPEHALSAGLSSVSVRHGPPARAVMRNCILILGTCWLCSLIWFVAM
jgi:type II secretory pathway component PulM